MLSHAWCANDGGGGGHMGGEEFLRIHDHNFFDFQFNVPTRGPMPGTSPDTGPIGDWGVDLRGSCMSMTLQSQLISNC